jgi:hypothetical protein
MTDNSVELPPPEYRCDAPGCMGWIVRRVGDRQKCRVHALAAAEEWALAYDRKAATINASAEISWSIVSLNEGKYEESWAHWTEAWALMKTVHSTERLLIQRGFFEETGH